jgi:hypothetical protein
VLKTNKPTTLEARCCPSADEAFIPSGSTAEANFVIEIEDVLEANIASGRSSAAKERNIVDFKARFSETACQQ